MRSTHSWFRKIKLKIVEARKAGMTYKDIRRRYGVSLNIISKPVVDPFRRYCAKCGETDPEKLQERYADRVNRPGKTVTLRANCRSEIPITQSRESVGLIQDN